jgi:salicylate hydroxylase
MSHRCDVRMEDGVNQRAGTSDEVREAYKGWDPRIDKMLEYVTDVLEWRVSIERSALELEIQLTAMKLYTHEELPTWTHSSNKLTLIGDAAHAMTPYLAQGAAMGIEDGAILGGILASPQFNTAATLPRALQLYEKLRVKRTARVAEASVDSRFFTQMPDGVNQRQRDEYLLTHPGIWANHINIRSRKEFLDELFGYDAYKVLEQALKDEASANKSQDEPALKAAQTQVKEIELAA